MRFLLNAVSKKHNNIAARKNSSDTLFKTEKANENKHKASVNLLEAKPNSKEKIKNKSRMHRTGMNTVTIFDYNSKSNTFYKTDSPSRKRFRIGGGLRNRRAKSNTPCTSRNSTYFFSHRSDSSYYRTDSYCYSTCSSCNRYDSYSYLIDFSCNSVCAKRNSSYFYSYRYDSNCYCIDSSCNRYDFNSYRYDSCWNSTDSSCYHTDASCHTTYSCLSDNDFPNYIQKPIN